MVTQVTKTLDNLVLEVRQIVQDTVAPYRYNDAWVVGVFNTALRDLYRIRPDAFIGSFTSGVLSSNAMNTYSTADLQVIDGVANPTPPSPATPMPFDDRQFYGAMVFYCVGRLEISDDQFTDNNRAMTLFGAFQQQLTKS